ncbi:hypothetical protein Ciccas_010003, partial [Cichlidogyrus casuarinus]
SKCAFKTAYSLGFKRGLVSRKKHLKNTFTRYPATVKEIPLKRILNGAFDNTSLDSEKCRKRLSFDLVTSPNRKMCSRKSKKLDSDLEAGPRKRICRIHHNTANVDFAFFMDAVKLSNLIRPFSNVKLEPSASQE